MKGLSGDIQLALDTVIRGLEYRFNEGDLLNPEKMQIIMKSKVSSFKSAKEILMKWANSPNAPTKDTLREYIKGVVNAGDKAILTLRHALRQEIDYGELDAEKHNQAIAAKLFITESVFDLNKSLVELRDKLEANAKQFRLGMEAAGFDLRPGEHAIVPVMLYDAELSQRFANRLLEEGIYVIGFFYPVVPKGLARIRVQLSAAHCSTHIEKAISAFTKVGRELGVI